MNFKKNTYEKTKINFNKEIFDYRDIKDDSNSNINDDSDDDSDSNDNFNYGNYDESNFLQNYQYIDRNNNKLKNKYININSKQVIIKKNIKKQIYGIEYQMYKKYTNNSDNYDKKIIHKAFYSIIPELASKYDPNNKEKLLYIYNIIMNILTNLSNNIINNTNVSSILDMWELYTYTDSNNTNEYKNKIIDIQINNLDNKITKHHEQILDQNNKYNNNNTIVVNEVLITQIRLLLEEILITSKNKFLENFIKNIIKKKIL